MADRAFHPGRSAHMLRQSPHMGSDETERLRICALSGFAYPESMMVHVEGRWVSRDWLPEPDPKTGRIFGT